MIDALFAPTQFFAARPERAYAVALVFLVLAWADHFLVRRNPAIKPWGMFVPAAAWLVYAMVEHFARLHAWTPRFDLYITWPIMAVLTAGFALIWIANLRRALRREDARSP
jgi:hypothetical protein